MGGLREGASGRTGAAAGDGLFVLDPIVYTASAVLAGGVVALVLLARTVGIREAR